MEEYKLNAYIDEVESLQCQKSAGSQIDQIFTNQMTIGYDNQTWNLRFLFESKPTICKCRVVQETKLSYEINCASNLRELYKPKQIRKITNLNDEVVLITGNNEVVLAIYLERSYMSQNYYTISYQQIFEPQYILIDIAITGQNLGVILADQLDLFNTYPYQNAPQQKKFILPLIRFLIFQTLSLSNFGNFFFTI